MIGLLDMASPQQKMQQPQPQMMGGLLDINNVNNQNNLSQNEGDENEKMLNEMLQNPTLETVQKIIEQISMNGKPESQQVIPILEKLKTPEQITEFATLVKQQRAINE